MKKTYVLDTNVLIQSPGAIYRFKEHNVVIPLMVLEELDGLKKAEGEKGANARIAIREFERIRLDGDLLDGVSLPEEGTLRIESNCVDIELPKDLPESKPDNRILQVCKALSEKGEDVVLITKDIVLRVKSQIIGIPAEDFGNEQVVQGEHQYTGRVECFAPEEEFKTFSKHGMDKSLLYTVDEEGAPVKPELYENEFVLIKADQSTKKTQLGRIFGDKVVPLEYKRSKPYGVEPRNAGQYFLQEALMAPSEEAPLVIVKGMAGTAKTFYSLAVGLEKILNNPTCEYRRILISRPNAQFDDEIGFLPGDEQEKIAPLLRPIMDNLEQLIDSDENERYRNELELKGKVDEVFGRGIIQAEALNYIRGRSIVKTYLIIDEAQNTTPNQIKGIITRAGSGTKIILLGDPFQIDKPFLDERTNGLSYAAEHMKGSKYCYQITMTAEECERSDLAMDAIGRL